MKETIIIEIEAKHNKKAIMKIQNNDIYFDTSDGEYGPIIFSLSILENSIREHKDLHPIPKDYKEITGHDNPEERAQYDLGREHEYLSTSRFIDKWDGSTNSELGSTLLKKFLELKQEGKI